MVCPDCNNSGVENKDTQDECETMFIVVYNQHDKRKENETVTEQEKEVDSSRSFVGGELG